LNGYRSRDVPGRRILILVTAATAAVVAVVIVSTSTRFAVRNPEAHLAADVLGGCIAGVAAILVGAQARRTQRLYQVLLAAALAWFSLTNLLFSALPVVLTDDPTTASAWAAVVARLIATALFAAASLTPSRAQLHGRGRTLKMLGATGVLLAAVGSLLAFTSDELPRPVTYEGLASGARVGLDSVPAFAVATSISLALFAVAALAFTRRRQASDDDLFAWLAAASIVAVGARALYLILPSLYSAWFSVADGLRLTFYVIVAIAVGRAVARNAASAVELAEVDARRRVARDVHDTFAQELSVLALRARHLLDGRAGGQDRETTALRELASGAQRALDQSRAVIRTLDEGTSDMGSLVRSLRRAAADATGRWGVSVELIAAGTPDLDGRQRSETEHIVREAIANAARHADPATIQVRLTGGRRPEVTVQDDGRGFDPSAASTGYGLTTMRARAAEIGATLEVRSQPTTGTRVTLRFR